MSSLDLNGMTLSCQGKDYRIPFNPPMSSYRDARERAGSMSVYYVIRYVERG